MPRTIQGWIKIDRRAAPSTETSEREREREREGAQLIWRATGKLRHATNTDQHASTLTHNQTRTQRPPRRESHFHTRTKYYFALFNFWIPFYQH